MLAAARKQAALEGTTVAKAVREFLKNYAAAHLPETAAAKRARRELVELAEQARASDRVSDWKWNREEICEERMGKLMKRRGGGFAEPPHHSGESPTIEEMTTDTGAPPEPGQDDWFRKERRSTRRKQANSNTRTSARSPRASGSMHARLSEDAEADLQAIFDYIHGRNPRAATRVMDAVMTAISHLETFPFLGKPGRVAGTRELVAPGLPYIVIYSLPDEFQIDIERVAVAAGIERVGSA